MRYPLTRLGTVAGIVLALLFLLMIAQGVRGAAPPVVQIAIADDGAQLDWYGPDGTLNEEWCPTVACIGKTLDKIGVAAIVVIRA